MGVRASVLGGVLRLLVLGDAITRSKPLADVGTEEGCSGRTARGHRSTAVRIRAGVLIQRLGHGRQAGRRGRIVGIPAVDGPVLWHGVLRRRVGTDGTPGVLLLLTADAGRALLLHREVAVTVTAIRRRWLLLEVVEGVVALLPPWTTTRGSRGGTRGHVG